MSARHAVPRSFSWGWAAITTIAVLTALVAGCGTGVALFWTSVVYDVGAFEHTLRVALVIAAIGVVAGFEVHVGLLLYRAHRRPS
jgi:hypothetical protein